MFSVKETSRLYVNPGSSHFGRLVTVVDSAGRGNRLCISTGEGRDWVRSCWLKDPDYPITHPKIWSRLVDLSTRDRLIDSSFDTCDRVARLSTEEAFGDCDLATKNSARITIYRLLKSPLEVEDRQLSQDVDSVTKELDDEGEP